MFTVSSCCIPLSFFIILGNLNKVPLPAMQLLQDDRSPIFYQERARADVLGVLKRNVPEVWKSQK